MNKKGLISIIVLIAILIGMTIFVNAGKSSTNISKDNISIVTAPDQKEAMENERFTVAVFEPIVLEGKNVAIQGRISANGFNDVYTAAFANDGRTESTSYWEGATGKESILTLNLKKAFNIHAIKIALNPAQIWGKRTQTMSISISEDGKNYTELVPLQDYKFDPKTGNEVVINTFKEAKTQYVQLTITKNTGANAGQVAEFEVYSKD